jgi:hypothetical protein
MALSNLITNYNNKSSLGSKFRANRIKPLLKIIENIYHKNGEVKILDVGGTALYWECLPDNFIQKHKIKITLLNTSMEDISCSNDCFSFIAADGCNLSLFGDKSFDIAHSNSVIEHVGDWERKVCFAHEIRRVATCYYVQTPNFWFPVEPHCLTLFFHWLPKPCRVFLVMHFNLGHWKKRNDIDQAVRAVESASLVTKKMLKSLFPDSLIITERFLFLSKSHIALRNYPTAKEEEISIE